MTLGEFTAVCIAIKEINGDNSLIYECEAAALTIPGALEQNFTEAEEAARTLRDISVADYLDDDRSIETLCDETGTSSDEDALLMFATGEERVRERIKAKLHRRMPSAATCLDELLESAFDGQLRAYWYRHHARK